MNARSAARRAEGRTKSDRIRFECTQCDPKGEIQEVFLNPGVTQASSALSHWITEYIHVFCPFGPALRIASCNSPFRLAFGHSNLLQANLVGCSLKLMDSVLIITFYVMARRASHRDVTSKSAPSRFCPAKNMLECRVSGTAVGLTPLILTLILLCPLTYLALKLLFYLFSNFFPFFGSIRSFLIFCPFLEFTHDFHLNFFAYFFPFFIAFFI